MWLGRGGQGSLFFLYVEGGWEGEWVDLFRQIHYGGGGGGFVLN